jgi:hypothetical protein
MLTEHQRTQKKQEMAKAFKELMLLPAAPGEAQMTGKLGADIESSARVAVDALIEEVESRFRSDWRSEHILVFSATKRNETEMAVLRRAEEIAKRLGFECTVQEGIGHEVNGGVRAKLNLWAYPGSMIGPTMLRYRQQRNDV